VSAGGRDGPAAGAAGGATATGGGPRLRVACVQMNTRDDVAANRAAAVRLVEEAVAAGARLIALPETWAFKGRGAGILASAEPVDGPSNALLADLARRHGVWVLAGSHYEPSPQPGRVYNTSALFGPDGRLHAAYRKLHLFDVVAGGTVYRESDEVVAGDEVVTADIEADGARLRLGLSVCYDLRFPELYRALALRGAQVLCVPSAFTAPTGAAHWEVLVRARAIENACFVVAPGQTGEHLPGRACWGHSMVVDPWGTVLAQLGDEVGVCVADLDLVRLGEVRERIPALRHRRPDVYG
jgi:predicted amidohydrolase